MFVPHAMTDNTPWALFSVWAAFECKLLVTHESAVHKYPSAKYVINAGIKFPIATHAIIYLISTTYLWSDMAHLAMLFTDKLSRLCPAAIGVVTRDDPI